MKPVLESRRTSERPEIICDEVDKFDLERQ